MKSTIQQFLIRNRKNMSKKALLLLLAIFGIFSYAQNLPEKPEDISPYLIGETLPDSNLTDAQGKTVSLHSVLSKPTVLVFYRGGWCPYCNAQLSGLAKVEKEVLALGYQIVAVSPDDFGNIAETLKKESVNYQLFSDSNAELIQKIGIGFKTADDLKNYLEKKRNLKSASVIPVPTVMIVNKNKEILFEYINPNYKQRLSPELLLAVLKNLK